MRFRGVSTRTTGRSSKLLRKICQVLYLIFFGILACNEASHQRFFRARRFLRDRGVLRVLGLASPRAYALVDRGWNGKSDAFRRLSDPGGVGLCGSRVRGVWRCLHCQFPPVAMDRRRHLARQVGHSGGAHLSARCGRHSLGSAGVRRVPPFIDFRSGHTRLKMLLVT